MLLSFWVFQGGFGIDRWGRYRFIEIHRVLAAVSNIEPTNITNGTWIIKFKSNANHGTDYLNLPIDCWIFEASIEGVYFHAICFAQHLPEKNSVFLYFCVFVFLCFFCVFVFFEWLIFLRLPLSNVNSSLLGNNRCHSIALVLAGKKNAIFRICNADVFSPDKKFTWKSTARSALLSCSRSQSSAQSLHLSLFGSLQTCLTKVALGFCLET